MACSELPSGNLNRACIFVSTLLGVAAVSKGVWNEVVVAYLKAFVSMFLEEARKLRRTSIKEDVLGIEPRIALQRSY